jgi:hypothetical protein
LFEALQNQAESRSDGLGAVIFLMESALNASTLWRITQGYGFFIV